MKAEIDMQTSKILSEKTSFQKKETGKLLFHPAFVKNENQLVKNSRKEMKEDYISMIQSLLF
ncbi:hypothetical protein JWG45_01755 [Leptospira sp. 201903070]|uniref:Uncharacterized protein n=1 Tax=Leptospira ainlahdjerensis TaxID=2810033 RepID=A0ABS2U9F2_9LEPT|nr:hypothetical protein [Leptospira ainlahdjerensis]MBM9575867.1 hypothetical protein [Leptospira ainlahdjerensis]